jgi:hypothetical protein
MDRRLSVALAEAVLAVHVAAVMLNVFGLVAIPLGGWRGWRVVRRFWWRLLHVAATAAVAVQAVAGCACFLTLWQDALADLGTGRVRPSSGKRPLATAAARRPGICAILTRWREKRRGA